MSLLVSWSLMRLLETSKSSAIVNRIKDEAFA